MCLIHSIPFHSDKPIVAYKVMEVTHQTRLKSISAGNCYNLHETHQATQPHNELKVCYCLEYGVGFHAYKKLEDANRHRLLLLTLFENIQVVEVELSEVTHKGKDIIGNDYDRCVVDAYVAKQCKFIRIVE